MSHHTVKKSLGGAAILTLVATAAIAASGFINVFPPVAPATTGEIHGSNGSLVTGAISFTPGAHGSSGASNEIDGVCAAANHANFGGTSLSGSTPIRLSRYYTGRNKWSKKLKLRDCCKKKGGKWVPKKPMPAKCLPPKPKKTSMSETDQTATGIVFDLSTDMLLDMSTDSKAAF